MRPECKSLSHPYRSACVQSDLLVLEQEEHEAVLLGRTTLGRVVRDPRFEFVRTCLLGEEIMR